MMSSGSIATRGLRSEFLTLCKVTAWVSPREIIAYGITVLKGAVW
jgi:hypothetical protein